MDESIIRAISLFFYLNLFDSKQAYSASQRTLAAWKDSGSNDRAFLIPLAMRVLRHARSMKFFSSAHKTDEFILPKDLKLDAWTEFKKHSDAAEYETVLWSQVLGFSDAELAVGLGVTEGTYPPPSESRIAHVGTAHMTEPTVFPEGSGQTTMSRFFCQELLFDYASGALPPERRKLVEEYLKTDEVCREDLMGLEKAQRYCQKLAKIEPPEEWIERWRNLPPALAKRLSNLETKLIGRLWMSLPYVVVFLLIAVGLIAFKPWKTLQARDVVVWKAGTSPVAAAPKVIPATPPSSPVETKTASTAPTTEIAPAPLSPPPVKSPKTVAEKEMRDEEETPTAAVASSAGGNEAEQSKQPGQMRGELYHAYLDVDEFDRATDEIKQKINELDGAKARAKELGWHRKKDESYFHFTLPESNLAALTEFLRSFGPVRISKEKHPVVMPQGTIRIILIVKDHPDDADETTP